MSRVIEVTELALSDAHQSLLATRMALEDMVPVCEDIDQAGYWSSNAGAGPPSTPASASSTKIPGSVCAPSAS